MLINDEGNSALHHVDLDTPVRNWTYAGAGRDLQLIGQHRVLRSSAAGYLELDLAARGALVRDVKVGDVPGGIESARRLPNGHTVVIGNGGGGIFVWELDAANQPLRDRQGLFAGIDKARMLRVTAQGTFLFCSETEGRSIVHELDWNAGLRSLFVVPDSVPADSMVKAVRVAPDVITVSTGYAASLLRIDTAQNKVQQTIGGKTQSEPAHGARPLSPFFYSGYQMLATGDFLISNWQGHSAERNGQGYQLLKYSPAGELLWAFDQTAFPQMASLNNVIALDGVDTTRLHDEPNGVLIPVG